VPADLLIFARAWPAWLLTWICISRQVDRELEFPMKDLENKAKAPGAGLFGSAWGALGWGK
jgi:hypothetical protein